MSQPLGDCLRLRDPQPDVSHPAGYRCARPLPVRLHHLLHAGWTHLNHSCLLRLLPDCRLLSNMDAALLCPLVSPHQPIALNILDKEIAY